MGKGLKIEAKELRIYNLVKCRVSNDAGTYRVLAVAQSHVSLDGAREKVWYHQDKIKPILLTEEWMKKLGYEMDDDFGVFYTANHDKDNVTLIIVRDVGFLEDLENRQKYPIKEFRLRNFPEPIKYVHQLQNLYFALTGEELELN